MNRALRSWLVFAASLAVVLGVMAWVSAAVFRLEREQAAARRQADLEERVRLALWRMDSAAAPIVAAESAWPAFAYRSQIPVDPDTGLYWPHCAASTATTKSQAGPLWMASPLLTPQSPYVRLYFTARLEGGRLQIDSPQRPTPSNTLVFGPGASVEQIETAVARIAELHGRLDYPQVVASLPALPAAADLGQPVALQPGGQGETVNVSLPPNANGQQSAATQPGGGGWDDADSQRAGQSASASMSMIQPSAKQQALNANEQQARAATVRRQMDVSQSQFNTLAGWELNHPAAPAELRAGPMTLLWQNGLLLMVRRDPTGTPGAVQGAWLDWPALRGMLLESSADLLPGASLSPAGDLVAARQDRMLASLPVVLLPGEAPALSAGPASPLRVSMLLAWAAVLAAATVAGVVLSRAVSLSERRGAFVSAVTHELRTPLTTFRMYAEMLSEGMVAEEKRGRYLATLKAEADRLSHLVANVLSYARLDGARPGGQRGRVAVSELLARVEDRLAQRARQAGLTLELADADAAAAADVEVDVSLVEQILFNLVDNAGKYAGRSAVPRVRIGVETAGPRVRLRVTDHGPGVPADVRRRLFQAFCKSAHQAADSAPGVGLGLALSRRLARQMGGDLWLDDSVAEGASFVLELPRAD